MMYPLWQVWVGIGAMIAVAGFLLWRWRKTTDPSRSVLYLVYGLGLIAIALIYIRAAVEQGRVQTITSSRVVIQL